MAACRPSGAGTRAAGRRSTTSSRSRASRVDTRTAPPRCLTGAFVLERTPRRALVLTANPSRLEVDVLHARRSRSSVRVRWPFATRRCASTRTRVPSRPHACTAPGATRADDAVERRVDRRAVGHEMSIPKWKLPCTRGGVQPDARRSPKNAAGRDADVDTASRASRRRCVPDGCQRRRGVEREEGAAAASLRRARAAGRRDGSETRVRGAHAQASERTSNGTTTARCTPANDLRLGRRLVTPRVTECYKRPTNAGLPDPRAARGEGRAGADRARGAEAARAPRRAAAARRSGRADRAARRRALRRGAAEDGDDVAAERRRRAPEGCSGRRRLVTRPPGYVLQIAPRAGRRAPLRAAPRGRAAGLAGPSAGRCSGGRSSSGAARRSPSSRSRTGRSRRPGASGELRLVALEERIEADIELGHAADVVAELESLVGEHPLRERLWYLLMSALQARGARRRRSTHTRRPAPRSTSSASSRARACAVSRARSSAARRRPPLGERARRTRRGRGGRQGARLRPRRPGARARRGRRPRRAARVRVRLPDRPAARSRPRLAVRRDDERLGPALRRAPPALRGGGRAAAGAPVPRRPARRCCASAARRTS